MVLYQEKSWRFIARSGGIVVFKGVSYEGFYWTLTEALEEVFKGK